MNLIEFEPYKYGKIFSDLIDVQRLNELGPGHENINLISKIESIDLGLAFGQDQINDTNAANACLAALWLLHDFLDQSHQISQSITTSSGSFWHGIMHRREGDYWNSKYWFRQVGNHPVFPDLNSAIIQLMNTSDIDEAKMLIQHASWDPFLFVDLVERHIGSAGEMEMILRQIQQLEWRLLFNYCFKKTIGEV